MAVREKPYRWMTYITWRARITIWKIIQNNILDNPIEACEKLEAGIFQDKFISVWLVRL